MLGANGQLVEPEEGKRAKESHEETANTRTYPASGLTYGDNTPTAASTVYIDGKIIGYNGVLARWLSLCLEVEEALRIAKEEEGRK